MVLTESVNLIALTRGDILSMTTCFKIKKPCILPARYIYVFCMIPSINSHKVFWIVRLCRWVCGSRYFEGTSLGKSVNHAPSHTASYPTRFGCL